MRRGFRWVSRVAGTVGVLAAVAGCGPTGQFDWILSDDDSGTYYTRLVPHDFSYLRSTSSGATACVKRSNGTGFCAANRSAHSYADSCNPANCLAYAKKSGGNSTSPELSVHEEWR